MAERLLPIDSRKWSTPGEGPTIFFDLETDGLVPSMVSVAVTKELGQEVRVWRSDEENFPGGFLDYLGTAGTLVAHNGLAYDLPVLKRLYGWEVPPHILVRDTLVISRLQFADRAEIDFKLPQMQKTGLIGSHSLKAWGIRLGLHKGDHDDWSGEITDELIEYAIRDAELLEKVWLVLTEQRPYCNAAVTVEHVFAHQLHRCHYHGFPLDIPKAQALAAELEELHGPLVEALELLFEPEVKVTPKQGKVSFKPFNPRSPKQQIARLQARGWEHNETTKSGQPKVDMKSIAEVAHHHEVQVLLDYLLVNKRLTQIKSGKEAWLKQVDPDDGRVHGTFIHLGTINNRPAHRNPNMSQVPRVGKPYGAECRECFMADGSLGGLRYPEVKLVGVDASGLEMRTLANRLHQWDGGALADEILNGDPHTSLMELLSDLGISSRDQSKTVRYAFNYGAGYGRLGKIAGAAPKRRVAVGKAIKTRMLKGVPGLKSLQQWVRNGVARYGSLPSLDGRRLYTRSPHSALNVLLAGDGIVIVKWAMALWQGMVEQELGLVWNRDYAIVCQSHDEWQTVVRAEYTETVGEMALTGLLRAGERLKVCMPIEGEAKIGRTWKDTH